MSDSSAAQIPVQNQNTTKWAWTIATFFGAGFGKPGPGTWGSAATVLLWAAVAYGLHPAPQTMLLVLLAAIALSLILGIPAATVVARESGRKDPQFVVIDEVAGQAITLLFSPIGWQYALTAFILFRLFDITKPFPCVNSSISPLAGASSSMMSAPACMLWVSRRCCAFICIYRNEGRSCPAPVLNPSRNPFPRPASNRFHPPRPCRSEKSSCMACISAPPPTARPSSWSTASPHSSP